MKISREEVNRIATLARLSLGEAEAGEMTRQLDAILEYVAQLESLDTTGVEPTAHVGSDATPMREDEPRPSLSQDAALANAPKSAGGGFVVPKTVDVGN
jgi:aspartyl-tRNA(Asn)/glutamyl-tRNA(Gln) amidotransferase subunit C